MNSKWGIFNKIESMSNHTKSKNNANKMKNTKEIIRAVPCTNSA